jgi:hypothetical protein
MWRFVAGILASNVAILNQYYQLLKVNKPLFLRLDNWNYFGRLRLILQCLQESGEPPGVCFSADDLLQPLIAGLSNPKKYQQKAVLNTIAGLDLKQILQNF